VSLLSPSPPPPPTPPSLSSLLCISISISLSLVSLISEFGNWKLKESEPFFFFFDEQNEDEFFSRRFEDESVNQMRVWVLEVEVR
jgi:hypothetical protein